MLSEFHLLMTIAISRSRSNVMQSSVVHHGRDPKRRLLCSAYAAQQRHDVEFVHVDGPFEEGLAVTAGRRVSCKQENDTTQNQ